MMTLLESTTSMVQASPPDTLAMVIPPNLLTTAEAVSTIILTLAVLGVLVALVSVLLQLRSLTKSVSSVTGQLERQASPVIERARSVAENVDYIAMAVRTDIQKVSDTVARLNDRLEEASERMEERIHDFNALVEVLQGEAEEMALDTAAAVRGVKAGARSLAGEHSGGNNPRNDPESLAPGWEDPGEGE